MVVIQKILPSEYFFKFKTNSFLKKYRADFQITSRNTLLAQYDTNWV